MRSTEDFTGRRFGALTVIAEVPPANYRNGKRWLCRCECGTELVLTPSKLIGTNGNGRRSCGKCGWHRYIDMPRPPKKRDLVRMEKKEAAAQKKARAANMEAIREMVRASGGMTYGQYVARRTQNGAD